MQFDGNKGKTFNYDLLHSIKHPFKIAMVVETHNTLVLHFDIQQLKTNQLPTTTQGTGSIKC